MAHLDAGQLVETHGETQTIDGIDWYFVRAGTDTWGWVSAGPPDDPYLEIHRLHPRNLPAEVDGVAGGEGGYLAWGSSARLSTDPRERFLVASNDGLVWHMVGLPENAAEAASLSAGFGPSGWLLASANSDGTAMGGLWRSTDGTAWEPLPVPLEPAMVPTSLIGHSGGYALAVRDDRSGTSSAAVFTSTDGRSWSALDLGIRTWGIELSALERGFVAWGDASGARPFVRLSLDGATWATDATARTIDGTGPRLVAHGDRLFAVTTMDDHGTMAYWTADAATPMNWTRVTPTGTALSDRSVDALVAIGERIVAITHRTDDGRAEMLASADGSTWDLLDVQGVDPDRWVSWWGGGIVAGRGGAVGVTAVTTTAGANPRFVRSADGARWEAEAAPVLGQVDSAVAGECPPAPTTGLEWMAIPWSIGAECFGSASISFDAYLTDAGGCGGFTPGRFEPDWLASPWATGRVILSLIEVDSAGCGSVALHPDAPPVPSTQQWVTVTGHWNDPASESCRYLPDPAFPGSGFQRDLIAYCRAVFVATSVVPAPGI